MTKIKIETVVLVDGVRIDAYLAPDRSRLLEAREQAIKRLEDLEFKTQETKDEIAEARRNLAEAIEAFDAEYAARKAAAAK